MQGSRLMLGLQSWRCNLSSNVPGATNAFSLVGRSGQGPTDDRIIILPLQVVIRFYQLCCVLFQ